MSWFTDLTNKFTGSKVGSGVMDLLGSPVGALGLSALVNKSGFGDTKIPQVGYQGKIPEYEAVRDRVAMPARKAMPREGADPNRRPGEAGRRYFSDTIFAQKGEAQPMSAEAARAKAKQQAMGLAGINKQELTDSRPPKDIKKVEMAQGGILAMRRGRYLNGSSDGMADEVPARIDSGQEARLSDGEFVIPADVVSHLGNGNSDAGAKALHAMMDRVRKKRTGNKKQGKEIDPKKMLPA